MEYPLTGMSRDWTVSWLGCLEGLECLVARISSGWNVLCLECLVAGMSGVRNVLWLGCLEVGMSCGCNV